MSSYLRNGHICAVHRFVGLLLATKLLPAGNKDVLVAISSAVGFRFLTRLLLPLKAHQVGPAVRYATSHHPQLSHVAQCVQAAVHDAEVQKSAAAAGLGLAVLSSLCRVQDLACSGDVLDKIPLFVKVNAATVSPLYMDMSRFVGTCMACSDVAGLIMQGL